MPKNKCPAEALTQSTRGGGGGSGGTHNHSFHFSAAIIITTTVVIFCCHVLVSAVPVLALPLHPYKGNHTNMGSKNQSQYSESKLPCLRHSLGLLDANFFNDKQIEELDNTIKEFNVPIIKADRKVVASENGGLHYPSPLIFNADWEYRPVHSASKRFNYPSISRIQRPESEEEIAFISVLELGELIKTKQITSQELTQIFLRRLKK